MCEWKECDKIVPYEAERHWSCELCRLKVTGIQICVYVFINVEIMLLEHQISKQTKRICIFFDR